MNDQEIRVLEDFIGYIKFSIKEKREFNNVLYDLNHDITGIAADDPYFLPRTKGYKVR